MLNGEYILHLLLKEEIGKVELLAIHLSYA